MNNVCRLEPRTQPKPTEPTALRSVCVTIFSRYRSVGFDLEEYFEVECVNCTTSVCGRGVCQARRGSDLGYLLNSLEGNARYEGAAFKVINNSDETDAQIRLWRS